MVDSNHRRRCQQIYSLSPLATREISHMELVNGVEPSTCWLQISCSAIEPHQHLRNSVCFRGPYSLYNRCSRSLAPQRMLLYHNKNALSIVFWNIFLKMRKKLYRYFYAPQNTVVRWLGAIFYNIIDFSDYICRVFRATRARIMQR